MRSSRCPRPARLAATGDDMTKFMIAQLNQGGPLLAPQTAQYMHKVNDTPIPGMPGMALGFYHEDRNGLNIIGHGGDTDWFHSDLHLYLDKHVGFFISLNSLGKDGNAHVVLDRTFADFTDRYFPQPTHVAADRIDRARARPGDGRQLHQQPGFLHRLGARDRIPQQYQGGAQSG